MRTREEHIAWCKQRARAAYDAYKKTQPDRAIKNALASMASDMSKHPETEQQIQTCAFLMFGVRDEESLFKFIDGFI